MTKICMCRKHYITYILGVCVLFLVYKLFPFIAFEKNLPEVNDIESKILVYKSDDLSTGKKISYSLARIVIANLTNFKNQSRYLIKTNATLSISTLEIINNSTDHSDIFCGYLVQPTWPWWSRLGNQIFMYASFYGIVKKQKLIANKTAFVQVADLPSPLDYIFPNLSIRRKIKSDSWIDSKNFTNLNEKVCCIYNGAGLDALSCDGKNVFISGYRQSYRYFETEFEEIKKEFTFRKSIQKKARKLLKENLAIRNLSSKKCITVGAHLRRGDFATRTDGYWPAQVDYLQRAIRYHETLHLGNNTQKIDCLVFLIFGDDYVWNLNATKQIEILKPNNTYQLVIDSKNSSAEIDLCAMQLCDHMILSTGSFSWWAGFFSKGVVTYQKEYAVFNSSLWFSFEPRDYFLPHWIAL